MTVKFISNMNQKQQKVFYRILVTFVILIVLSMLHLNHILSFFLYMFPYIIIGHDILKKGWKGITRKQIFDENFLMMIATIGAFLLGEYLEACAVMLFYQIGELFQSYAVGKSRESIIALMDICPEFANLLKADGSIEEVDPYEIELDDIIVVRPGEKVAIDGVIVKGESTLSLSALNGESLPKDVYEGDEILSGSVNLTSLIHVQAKKVFEDSTVSKISELVENASSNKSKMEQFISRFAKWYTPFVCICALLLVMVPPIVLFILQQDVSFTDWLFRGLTFLVISCPCALVISIPMTFFAGLGTASAKGILIKGSNYLEALSLCDTMVFDKTGTLTKGVFEVVEINSPFMSQDALLEYSAYAEYHCVHPIALSIVSRYAKEIQPQRISQFLNHGGKGVEAYVDQQWIYVGTKAFLKEQGIECPLVSTNHAIVYIAINHQYAGYLCLSDCVKEDAVDTLSTLHRQGIKKCIMMSGDRQVIAQAIAKQVGIDEVYANCLPTQKMEHLENVLCQQQNNRKVAYVGDGVNDAPVLMRADVGIAMGVLGSDAAIEAADIVLTDDKLSKLTYALKLSKKCMRIVYQNIILALGVKFLCLFLGAIGFSNMWMAIFADVGVMVLAVLNALRSMILEEK